MVFYGLYMQSHGLNCEILPTILQNIYIFTAHIVQKNFLKAMRGRLEAMRVLLEARDSAFRGRESTCRSN